MDYITEAENHLKYYRVLKRSIEHMDREKQRIQDRNSPKDIGAAALELTGIRSGQGQDDTMNIIYKIVLLDRMQNETQDSIFNTDRSLIAISQEHNREHYGELLRQWYINKKDIESMCIMFNICKTQLYEHRNEAIRRFAISIFGLRAMKAIV